MVGAKTAGSRVTIVDDEIDGFRVVIATTRLWSVRLFLGLFVGGWTWVEANLVSEIVTSRPSQGHGPLFAAVGLVLWTVGWLRLIWVFAWSLAGREVVIVDEGHLVIRSEIVGLGVSSRFDLAEVIRLRYDQNNRYRNHRQREYWVILLTTDHGVSRFGFELSEEDTSRVIDAILGKIKLATSVVA